MSNGFILYHVKSAAAATAILRSGLVDGESSYGTETQLRGVFLSNRALETDEGVGPSSDIVLAVTFASTPLSDLDEYELVEEERVNVNGVFRRALRGDLLLFRSLRLTTVSEYYRVPQKRK